MGDLIILALYTVIPLLLLGLGFFVGRSVEKSHFRDLDLREREFAGIVQVNMKRLPPNWKASQPVLVQGQAVIASDYFKTFASQIRNLFGGEVRSLESLMVRARLEARLRMLEEAKTRGLNCICNIREETSTITKGSGKRGLMSAEVYVYGTAVNVR
ncbi:MAG: hypothetical protein CSA81_00570 [Acidobacteria bacterium]|nr:MAG: hypothetical protein CSA81_00570 [Acidobacteriota bacterium]